jgi:FixJ family two-component response regulator
MSITPLGWSFSIKPARYVETHRTRCSANIMFKSQVLERIVAGRLNKQIADDLGISIKTVEAHRANIMEKLGANTVADLLKTVLGQNAPKV